MFRHWLRYLPNHLEDKEVGQTEPKPFWGWLIKGMGGCINIAEGWIRDGITPSEGQEEQFEYQVRRMIDVYESYSGVPCRSKADILATRSFGVGDVQDSSLRDHDGTSPAPSLPNPPSSRDIR